MSYFIRLINGQPQIGIILEQNLREVVPELRTEPVLTKELLSSHGFGMLELREPPSVTEKYKKAVEIVPTYREKSGIWLQAWDVVDMTSEERQVVDNTKAQEVRNERNYYLRNSDWTQLPDAPLSQEKKLEWTQYRQQLRDVTQQHGFPWTVVWPTKPE